MSTLRNKRSGGSSGLLGQASAAASNLTTQTPQGSDAGFASTTRVPRAHGLVGLGVGPADAGVRTYADAGGAGSIFDLSSVFTWRTALFLLAVSYIVGFHVTLPGLGRIRI